MENHARIPVLTFAAALLLLPSITSLALDAQTPRSRPAPPGERSGVAVPRGGEAATTGPYVVAPPDGKMPWPQHAPGFTRAQYDQMMAGLFIINNFGLYQEGDSSRESVYFHNGLDVVLRNGTNIHAIASGTVRAINGGAPYYLTVVVEDEDKPGWAWTYTHVAPGPGTTVGAYVRKGTVLATVRFQGVEHVHLNRTFLTPGGSWRDFFDHNNVDPAPFFAFEDTEAPVIETPFYYFLNESDSMLPRGTPTLVSGQVDVVAGIRDPGKYAHGIIPGSSPANQQAYGDRNAPKGVAISIAPASDPGRVVWGQVAIDFEKVILSLRRPFLRDPDLVETVFAFRRTTNPDAPASNNRIASYYYLTNASRAGEPRALSVGDGAPAWDTTALDANGRSRFPDGEYIVTVTAWDWHENRSTAQDRVVVLNR